VVGVNQDDATVAAACSTRSTLPGSWPPPSTAGRRPACWTRITTNATSRADQFPVPAQQGRWVTRKMGQRFDKRSFMYLATIDIATIKIWLRDPTQHP
jgi:hypothetical protein